MSTNRSFLFLILFFGLIACDNQAQTREQERVAIPTKSSSEKIIKEETLDASIDPSLKYRNENWHPEKGQYFFGEYYIFSYYNGMIAEGNPGAKGKFGFYLDPESGTILLERYNTLYGDEMTDYIIIEPNGNYIAGYTDEFGEKRVEKENLYERTAIADNLQYVEEEFNQFFEPQQMYQSFGANKYYDKTLKGQKYLQTFHKTSDVAEVYLADTNLPTTALYLIDRMYDELRMPIRWDYGYVIPNNKLVVKEYYKSQSGESTGFELMAIEAGEYHIQLPKK